MNRLIPVFTLSVLIPICGTTAAATLESDLLKVEIDETTGRWYLLDKRSGAAWPSDGAASAGAAAWLEGGFTKADTSQKYTVTLLKNDRPAVTFALVDRGSALELRYENKNGATVRVLGDALAVTDTDAGWMVVPCREGLLIPADSGRTFKRVFGTSEYEGCH
ncbi:MAG: hypothetical protein JSU94_05455, partial [Phycisphaerales bacterium]